jgi:hypothetical protein
MGPQALPEGGEQPCFFKGCRRAPDPLHPQHEAAGWVAPNAAAQRSSSKLVAEAARDDAHACAAVVSRLRRSWAAVRQARMRDAYGAVIVINMVVVAPLTLVANASLSCVAAMAGTPRAEG